jgi:hypothetical protein
MGQYVRSVFHWIFRSIRKSPLPIAIIVFTIIRFLSILSVPLYVANLGDIEGDKEKNAHATS